MVIVDAVTPGPLRSPVILAGGATVAPVDPPPTVGLVVPPFDLLLLHAANDRPATPARQASAARRFVSITVCVPPCWWSLLGVGAEVQRTGGRTDLGRRALHLDPPLDHHRGPLGHRQGGGGELLDEQDGEPLSGDLAHDLVQL